MLKKLLSNLKIVKKYLKLEAVIFVFSVSAIPFFLGYHFLEKPFNGITLYHILTGSFIIVGSILAVSNYIINIKKFDIEMSNNQKNAYNERIDKIELPQEKSIDLYKFKIPIEGNLSEFPLRIYCHYIQEMNRSKDVRDKFLHNLINIIYSKNSKKEESEDKMTFLYNNYRELYELATKYFVHGSSYYSDIYRPRLGLISDIITDDSLIENHRIQLLHKVIDEHVLGIITYWNENFIFKHLNTFEEDKSLKASTYLSSKSKNKLYEYLDELFIKGLIK